MDPLGYDAGDVNLYRALGNGLLNRLDPSGLDWADTVAGWIGVDRVRRWDNYLGHHRTGWFAQTSNFAAAMADTVSLGATGRMRRGLAYDDVVDYGSKAYERGVFAGTVVNTGLAFVNPCAVGGRIATGVRVINGVQTGVGVVNAADNLAAGNYVAATEDLLGVMGNSFQVVRPCFPGDVQVLTRRGWVRWDTLRAGDEVLSLPEAEPEGELAYRVVEEVFERWGVIWEVALVGWCCGRRGSIRFGCGVGVGWRRRSCSLAIHCVRMMARGRWWREYGTRVGRRWCTTAGWRSSIRTLSGRKPGASPSGHIMRALLNKPGLPHRGMEGWRLEMADSFSQPEEPHVKRLRKSLVT